MFKNKILTTISEQIGTPCYVYAKAAILKAWHEFNNAFGDYSHQINYAVKANSNLAILNIFAKINSDRNSGFDIVSGGELKRVLAAKGQAHKITFSGVGKTKEELKMALQVGVGCINIESEAELLRLNQIAISMNKIAAIAIRVNPNIDAKSHPYISTGLLENKFGVDFLEAKKLYTLCRNLPGIKIKGIAFHIGSQITSLSPFLMAIDQILELIKYLDAINIHLEHINIGGGLGVNYNNTDLAAMQPPSPQEYVAAILLKLKPTNLAIHIEPGRALVANAGILLTKVEYIKHQASNNKYFAIVDAAMNDLIRPALYESWHDIKSLNFSNKTESKIYDIVGPICETADFLGKARNLVIQENDLLIISSAGAYGFSMSSNYNSRPRSAEVMVEGEDFYVIRNRETLEDLFKSELADFYQIKL